MAVETDIERAVFIEADDFGTTVTKADTSTFEAIFDNGFLAVGGSMQEVESLNPVLQCRSSDVSDLVHGSVLTLNSTTYHVVAIEPDGTGMTMLELEKQ